MGRPTRYTTRRRCRATSAVTETAYASTAQPGTGLEDGHGVTETIYDALGPAGTSRHGQRATGGRFTTPWDVDKRGHGDVGRTRSLGKGDPTFQYDQLVAWC